MGILCALAWLCTAACSHAQTDEPVKAAVRQYQYQVVASYPHDRRAFTQGLVYENGLLYEGTGLYGQSTLAKRDLKTGKALKTIHLARGDFGEGIAVVPDPNNRWGGDRIVQLTWRNKKGFVYKKDTFTLLEEFTYPTEGWGITYDGTRLIYSDGTATLRFLDPNTLAMTGRIEVRDQGRPVRDLNELEYIEGSVFANVWLTDEIVVLDPKTGQVTGRLDLSTLYPRPENSEDVLNGIAWIPESKHLLVTGKLWPKIYEIELISGSTDGSQQ
jgi:glutaminyl-peptide cyclotransferase